MPKNLFVSKLSPEQWAEARRLRAEGSSLAEIAERFGVHPDTISKRARRERWRTPDGTASRGRGRAAKKGRRPSPATVDTLRRLAVRLYEVSELEIRMMELRMTKRLDDYEQSPDGAEPPAVTKDERDSFAALIDNINKVTEMASEPASAADGRRKSASRNPELTALSDDLDAAALDAASEKDEFRREIADKLEKLVPPA